MLNETMKATIRDAAQKLTGARKRAFMAKVADDYFEGSALRAERQLGWGRQSVQLGLHERRTGITCVDNYRARGRQRSEAKPPNLETDIRELVDKEAQADPTFQSTFYYARVSARAVREALITEKGYHNDALPNRQTIGNVLNRMGYRLKNTKGETPEENSRNRRYF